ncbi:MAG: stalk domain-containing protein [Syntrophomonadaceae bacterium]|nr:stalk domain-containing protein [Syntrophomonadaceae bacterium]
MLLLLVLLLAVPDGRGAAGGESPAVQYYQDGVPLSDSRPDFSRDVKKVTYGQASQQLTDYPAGCQLTLPLEMQLDFSISPAFTRASSDRLDLKISREYSPYDDLEMYFEQYLFRYLTSEEYRQANRIELLEDGWTSINSYPARLLSFRRIPAEGSPERQNQYLLAAVMTGGRVFYHLSFRTDSLDEQRPVIEKILASFTARRPVGKPAYCLQLEPEIPDWNQETLACYQQLCSRRGVQWGFFSPGALDRSYARVARVEEALDYRFGLLLHYLYLDAPFPAAEMQRAYERGQLVELTLQTAALSNDGGSGHNLNFDLLDGRCDEQLRRFARGAKAFGHPFLFRLNNEMNTDWARYGGVLLLSDPDLYVRIWRKVYQVFQEEGVDNAIWVFNPNDRSYPPVNWNRQAAYYPGNRYVQVIGLTGYNTGDYYREVTGEGWRSFSQIYDPLVEEYRSLYRAFPWIITEFACSSVGGDKERWINEMFARLPRYPEIKAAVWWSYADFDQREGKNVPARRYWLEERPEYLRAFRAGLHGVDPGAAAVETGGLDALPVRVEVDGRPVEYDRPPGIVGGRLLVPVRQTLEALGAEVEWQGEAQKIFCRRGEATVILQVDSREALVNGRPLQLEVAPQLLGGRAIVPLRRVVESLGAAVTWDEASRTARVDSGGAGESGGGQRRG